MVAMSHISDQLLALSRVAALADQVDSMALTVTREQSGWYRELARDLMALVSGRWATDGLKKSQG
jgi:hypothetical protein